LPLIAESPGSAGGILALDSTTTSLILGNLITDMTRAHRSNRELQEASNHLYYEYTMLISLAQGLASGIATKGWLANVMLEAFVIHFRVLLDFFYSETPRNDDIVADDYFDNPSDWGKIKPATTPELLSLAKTRAHKELAHLTYARLGVTPEQGGWPFVEIAKEIQSLMELFLRNVPDNRLGPPWQATST